MKTTTKIIEITKDDLVNLFSTGLYGSNIIGATYSHNVYEEYCEQDIQDCLEDKMAKVLLKGGKVFLFDEYAEDENDYYGTLPKKWNEDDCEMMYTVTLKDIRKGLEKALNEGGSYIQECVRNLMDDEGCNLDLPQAESILQYIMFGEVIYG